MTAHTKAYCIVGLVETITKKKRQHVLQAEFPRLKEFAHGSSDSMPSYRALPRPECATEEVELFPDVSHLLPVVLFFPEQTQRWMDDNKLASLPPGLFDSHQAMRLL